MQIQGGKTGAQRSYQIVLPTPEMQRENKSSDQGYLRQAPSLLVIQNMRAGRPHSQETASLLIR